MDTRVRFGFCESLDLDPQVVFEYPQTPDDVMVAVIPLPQGTPMPCPALPPGYQIASDQ
jgi:hypothetical protein